MNDSQHNAFRAEVKRELAPLDVYEEEMTNRHYTVSMGDLDPDGNGILADVVQREGKQTLYLIEFGAGDPCLQTKPVEIRDEPNRYRRAWCRAVQAEECDPDLDAVFLPEVKARLQSLKGPFIPGLEIALSAEEIWAYLTKGVSQW